MSALETTVQPTSEPVSWDEAKAELHLDVDDEQPGGERKLLEARAWAEAYTRRCFITQTLKQYEDAFPAGNVLELLRSPVTQVVSVKYTDQNGTLQTLVEGTDYQVDLVSERCRIAPVYGRIWPTPRRQFNAIVIEFKAGYGAAVANIPADVLATIREGILARTVDSFENRGSVVVGSINSRITTRTAETILDKIKIFEVS